MLKMPSQTLCGENAPAAAHQKPRIRLVVRDPPQHRKRRHLRHAESERHVDLQQAAFTSYQINSLSLTSKPRSFGRSASRAIHDAPIRDPSQKPRAGELPVNLWRVVGPVLAIQDVDATDTVRLWHDWSF